MDGLVVHRLVTDSLLVEASEGLDGIAHRLTGLGEGWIMGGADPRTLSWLAGVIDELGWWSGRLIGGLSTVEPSEFLAVRSCQAPPDDPPAPR